MQAWGRIFCHNMANRRFEVMVSLNIDGKTAAFIEIRSADTLPLTLIVVDPTSPTKSPRQTFPKNSRARYARSYRQPRSKRGWGEALARATRLFRHPRVEWISLMPCASAHGPETAVARLFDQRGMCAPATRSSSFYLAFKSNFTTDPAWSSLSASTWDCARRSVIQVLRSLAHRTTGSDCLHFRP